MRRLRDLCDSFDASHSVLFVLSSHSPSSPDAWSQPRPASRPCDTSLPSCLPHLPTLLLCGGARARRRRPHLSSSTRAQPTARPFETRPSLHASMSPTLHHAPPHLPILRTSSVYLSLSSIRSSSHTHTHTPSAWGYRQEARAPTRPHTIPRERSPIQTRAMRKKSLRIFLFLAFVF